MVRLALYVILSVQVEGHVSIHLDLTEVCVMFKAQDITLT